MWDLEGGSIPDLPGYGQAAAGATARPAADNAGKHPGVAAGADDHQPARPEFVDGLAGQRGGAALGDALRAGDHLVAGDLAQPVQFFVEPRLRTAGVPEGPFVLGADDENRIAARRRFDVTDRLLRRRHAARQ